MVQPSIQYYRSALKSHRFLQANDGLSCNAQKLL